MCKGRTSYLYTYIYAYEYVCLSQVGQDPLNPCADLQKRLDSEGLFSRVNLSHLTTDKLDTERRGTKRTLFSHVRSTKSALRSSPDRSQAPRRQSVGPILECSRPSPPWQGTSGPPRVGAVPHRRTVMSQASMRQSERSVPAPGDRS